MARANGYLAAMTTDDRVAAWSAVHDATPPGWLSVALLRDERHEWTQRAVSCVDSWSGRLDSNQRPLDPHSQAGTHRRPF